MFFWLKHIRIYLEQIRYDLDLKAEVNCLRLSQDGRMLFLGTNSGRVRSVPFPLSYTQQEVEELSAHLGEITKVKFLLFLFWLNFQ